jgi:hypothetical protein
MWRAVICLCAALTLSTPCICHAQYVNNDQQNPRAYHNDEDSQPIRLIAYVLAPLGFALEWCVARPMHYVANDTALAPVFNGYQPPPPYVPPVPLVPPDKIVESAPPPSMETAASAPAAAAAKPSRPARSAPSKPSGQQPALR